MSKLKRFFHRAAILNPLASLLSSEEEKRKIAKELYAERMAESEFKQFYRRGVDGYLALADKRLKAEIGYSEIRERGDEAGCQDCQHTFETALLCQWTFENYGVALVVDPEGFCNHLERG